MGQPSSTCTGAPPRGVQEDEERDARQDCDGARVAARKRVVVRRSVGVQVEY
jgi:hypothetical protein